MSETVGETDTSPPPPPPPVIVGGGDDVIEERKSVDKLEIEKEEKKQMLVSGGGGGEVEKKKKALEEAALTGEDKRRVPPIGGIKIPGFLTSKRNSKSNHTKSKDGDDGEEKADLLETPSTDAKSPQSDSDKDGDKNEPQSTASAFFARMGKLKVNVPKCVTNVPVPAFIRRKKNPDVEDGVAPPPQEGTQEDAPPKRPKLINAIRLPLASLVPKKLKSKDGDETQQAGLASVETLDETRETENKEGDGMENVHLDVVQIDPEKAALEEEESKNWNRRDWRRWWNLIKDYKLTVCGILIFIILLIILIVAILSGPSVPTHAPIVDGKFVSAVTSCGLVEGVLEDEAFVFRGIPYARPPVNELRFRPPQLMQLQDCWNGTLKTHNATPSCWQVFTNGSLDGQEDCLRMDIMTPAVRYDNPLPVIVVLGTDSLLGGWPSKMVISPKISKLKDVVIVRPNIRLGILGFLAARPLSQSTYPRSSGNNLKLYPRTSGNYGLADLVHALEWIQLNIAHFGGDSKSVTLFGYRSGATLGVLLTALRKPERLFNRLWLSSPTTVFPKLSLLESEGRSDSYISSLGCHESPTDAGQAECLRKQDVEDLISAIPQDWRPRVDGVLPKGPAPEHQWLVQDGHHVRQHPYDAWTGPDKSWNFALSIVIGTTLHSEITPEWYEARKNWTPEQVKQEVMDSQIGKENLIAKVFTHYNATVIGLASMISDIATVCPMFAMHKLMPNTRFYLATQPVDATTNSGLVYGGADIDVILGTFSYRTSPPQRRFVAVMRNMFYDFVSLGRSPYYSLTNVGQDANKFDTLDLEKRCALWKDVGFDKFAKLE